MFLGVMQKHCSRCGEEKSVSAFKVDPRYKDGFSSFCKSCHQAASLAWQKANKEKLNDSRRKRYARNRDQINAKRRAEYCGEKARSQTLPYRYGITSEEYDNLLHSQGGCAICGRKQEGYSRKFSVDHDHSCCPGSKTCGKCVRGIICHPCNVALNALEQNEEWPERAREYLRSHK